MISFKLPMAKRIQLYDARTEAWGKVEKEWQNETVTHAANAK